MKNVLSVVIAASFLGACGGQGARHFRVVADPSMSSLAYPLPDECQPTVTTATTMAEQMTSSFCGYATPPTSSGSSSEGLFMQEDWTVFEAEGNAYLVRSQQPTGSVTSTGAIEGTRKGAHYVFIGVHRNWNRACVADPGGPLPRECNGVCANTYSDRSNCGNCGVVCPTGQGCVSGTCAPLNCSQQSTCGGVSVNLATDNNNCGFCGRQCPTSTVCTAQGYGNPPNCVPPSMNLCATSPAPTAAPMTLTNEQSERVEFDLKGGDLVGTLTDVTAYSCDSASCVADFAGRCPSCTRSSPVTGSEAPDVQAFQVW